MKDRLKKLYEKMINMKEDVLDEIVETEEGPEELDRIKKICKKLDEVRDLVLSCNDADTMVRHMYSCVATLFHPLPNTAKARILKNVARTLQKIGDVKKS